MKVYYVIVFGDRLDERLVVSTHGTEGEARVAAKNVARSGTSASVACRITTFHPSPPPEPIEDAS